MVGETDMNVYGVAWLLLYRRNRCEAIQRHTNNTHIHAFTEKHPPISIEYTQFRWKNGCDLHLLGTCGVRERDGNFDNPLHTTYMAMQLTVAEVRCTTNDAQKKTPLVAFSTWGKHNAIAGMDCCHENTALTHTTTYSRMHALHTHMSGLIIACMFDIVGRQRTAELPGNVERFVCTIKVVHLNLICLPCRIAAYFIIECNAFVESGEFPR